MVEAGPQPQRSPISTTKLVILALLGFCAVVLGSAVLTLQLHVLHERQLLQSKSKSHNTQRKAKTTTILSPETDADKRPKTTIRPSKPTTQQDIRLADKFPPPQGASWKVVRNAYWRQAAAFMKDWDALQEDSLLIPDARAYSRYNHTATPRWALEQAAHAGHVQAQQYMANVYASGIWPMRLQDDYATSDIHVLEEWAPVSHLDYPQMTKAFILWHMAAKGGSIEAAMALAYRLAAQPGDPDEPPPIHRLKAKTKTHDQKCLQVLPYYEAAAHGIMDWLEASSNSRAKTLPAMDRHLLAQVFLKGGTSSQLDYFNKPDHNEAALQFYHLKATKSNSWMARFAGDTKKEEPPIDVGAAHILAQLYHTGSQGVEQNLTKALQYYEIAATHGHWESAGEAGTFYLWGMGVDQDATRAHELFSIGAPLSIDGCRRRHDQALLKRKKGNDPKMFGDISECDDTSLNGMGLLHLLGIAGRVPINLELAEKYFTLAKEKGSADAMYNLAMMWLGWKTHFKLVEDLKDEGMSNHDDRDVLLQPKAKYSLHYSKRIPGKKYMGPTQSEIKDAIVLLTKAANKHHIQAKHRLGMIYSEGIQIETAALKYDVVPPDCTKARGMFQWISEQANPVRSQRLRKAYKDYMAGNLESSLRNYLAAAETGSSIAQVNAAFLLEQGTCLGLKSTDCAKASVRLWKAAAARGSMEAFLRVGDFYYYGRLRGNRLPSGPFGWIEYFLFPEIHLFNLLRQWKGKLWEHVEAFLEGTSQNSNQDTDQDESQPMSSEEIEQHFVEADMVMAAQFYTEAVEKYQSPRANFNLGFMHEWGLGLKQDFPLAKRHYDLAMTTGAGPSSSEAQLAVQIALLAMDVHQYWIKFQVGWQGQQAKRDVLLAHIFHRSTLWIVLLCVALVQVMSYRNRRRRQR